MDIFDNKEKVESLKREFRQANIILLVTDITKKDIIERTFKVVLERFKRIDIVVNSAGILRESEMDLVINTNLVFISKLFFFIFSVLISIIFS